jgi:hypothetical protein
MPSDALLATSREGESARYGEMLLGVNRVEPHAQGVIALFPTQ